jgi:phosphocarrier protein HPr
MMCFDPAGPVNNAAYAFATGPQRRRPWIAEDHGVDDGGRRGDRDRRQAVRPDQARVGCRTGTGRYLIPTLTNRGDSPIYAKTVLVGSAIGLHARPAAIIAEAIAKIGVPVQLSLDGGEPVDAGSALMIMTLGAGNGAQVTVASDDEAATNSIAELVQQDLDA